MNAQSEKFTRFKDAPWFSDESEPIDIIIGGAGGIGSWLALFLNRAGFNTIIYDFDTIEGHNIGGQFFRESDVGKKKTEALSNLIEEFCKQQISTYDQAFTKDSMSHVYMISAFDNMKARKDFYEVWKKSFSQSENIQPILIDGRLLMEQMQIFCVTPETTEKYEEEHLFSDDEVETETCTLKQTTHSAAMIASFMVGFFTNHMTNVKEKKYIRDVPFSFEFFIPLTQMLYDK